jgi:hypothetical protein
MGLINRKQSAPQKNSEDALSLSEMKFILKAMSESKFEGKDVFVVSSIVQKLSAAVEAE